MKKRIYLLLLLACCGSFQMLSAQYFGDVELKDVSGEVKPVSSYADSSTKAMVIIFSGIHCVYSKKYEDRIMALVQEYSEQGISFVMVNSNDPKVSYEDGFEHMVEHAAEKGYSFPYLVDHEHLLADALDAEKTPETFVFVPGEEQMELYYNGAIDDNPLLAERVKEAFLKNALDALLLGEPRPDVDATIKGCHIKRMY